MGLESGTSISDLNPNWPLGTDPKSQGDDHIRLIKQVLQDSLANGEIGKTPPTAGQVFAFAGAAAPAGALACDGSEVAKADYPELYTAIGDAWATTFGAAAPSADNFRLPPAVDDNGKPVFCMPGIVGTGYNPLVGQHYHSMNHGHADNFSIASAGAHTHKSQLHTSAAYNNTPPYSAAVQQDSPPNYTPDTSSAGAHTHTVNGGVTNYSGNTGNAGTANDNRPPAIGVLMCIYTGQ